MSVIVCIEFNVPFKNILVMSGWSQCFLDANQCKGK